MVKVTFYDSFEEMMEAEQEARAAADVRVQPWQEKSRADEILVSDSGYDFPIFHEILDPEKIVGENLKKHGDEYEDEGIWFLDLYREPHMKCFRFARNYSEACPEGELGDFHLSVAFGKIRREAFEELKERGFRLYDE
ncbi:MAG: hypothetical protein KJ621_11775 [Proteobacteria bacterium]|nr:hypothetical protein [Pseudomonadota bacterium]